MKGKSCTSDSGSSSNMGRVADDCKKKKKKKDKVGEEESTSIQVLTTRKPKYICIKDKVDLKITYFPLSDRHRRRGCLPLTTPCLAGRRSTCGWPWSSRLRLADSRACTRAGAS